jgi:antitoxin VapB
MAVNLKNLEAERLLHELARETDEGLTEAATKAFRERLERVRLEKESQAVRARVSLQDLITEARRSPLLDARSEKQVSDELWGEP